jgi:hypothetical protein
LAAAAAAAVAAVSKASRRKRSISFQLQQRAPYLAPGFSTRTSMMLQSMPTPLEHALSDGLGSKDIPVLFLHGVGGLPAYLEMLMQVRKAQHLPWLVPELLHSAHECQHISVKTNLLSSLGRFVGDVASCCATSNKGIGQ